MILNRTFLIGLSLIGTLFSSGCASTLNMPWMSGVPRASAKNPVVQIACMWEPSEGRDPNGAPCKGFAGQILFLGNKGGIPVAVDGEVMIYVFDDIGSAEEQTKPVHQFHFDSGAWEQHMKVGSLGPAYHCFIPYTRPGGLEAKCSLRVKLTPSGDLPPLMSDSSNIAIQGKSRHPSQSGPQMTQLSRQAFQTSLPPEVRNARTTTIPLNQSSSANSAAASLADNLSSPETQEQRIQRILQEHRQQQALADQGSTLLEHPKASPRLKWDTSTSHSDSGIVQASYEE